MRRIAILLIAVAVLFAVPATAQDPPVTAPWAMPESLEDYLSLTLEEKVEIFKAVVATPFFLEWRGRRLAQHESSDPSLGGYDDLLLWLPLSPQDMLKVDMVLRHYEVAVPRITNQLHQRWLTLHFGSVIELSHSDETQSPNGIRTAPPAGGTKATVDTNRNSAYDYAPAPDEYDGEIQVVVNPLNANQIVSMANTWDNMGDVTNCAYGTQAIFFSSNGGTNWGYTCAPRGALYGLSCASGLEIGSDPALYWDDSNNVFGNYMSLCFDSTGTLVSGYAMVVARSTDGGATWTPHGVLKDSYSTGTIEDKNFYIIDNHPTSPYYGRHYACWDRNNNELIRYSTDGGVNWNEVNIPNVGSGLDLGCEMAIEEDDGTFHLIFDNLTCGFTTCSDEDMYYTQSTDGGASWSSLVHVRDITDPISFGSNAKYGPQNERGLNPFGSIDVDNSGGACDGYLYVTFTDDADANGVGTADIWVMRSTDGGGTWGPAVRVNDTPDPDTSIQFHPVLVIDQASGAVVVTWHDARNDPANHAVDFYVARSIDCGQTWANVQASRASSEFNNSSISYTNENSTDNPNYNPNQYGEYMGLDVLNGTAYLAWTDSRHFFPGSPTEPQKENVGFAKVRFCEAVAPTGFSASPEFDNSIELLWDAVTGAAEYRIYRSTTSASGYTQVATVTAPTTVYLDAGVQGGVTYYYVVTTYDGAQACESVFSSEASATPTGLCDLAPTFSGISSAASNDNCAIDLAWPAATAICDGPVNYSVYRSATSGFTPSLANRIAVGLGGTSFTDASGMSSGATYHYIVRATDQSNGQEDTNTVEESSSPTGPGVGGTWSSGAETGDSSMFTNGSWSISSAWPHSDAYSFYSGYSNNLCAYLRTPQLSLTPGEASTLTYWTAWSIENGWDGGVVEISTNGGSTWSELTPTPGYPSSIDDFSQDACGYGAQRAYTGLNNLTFAEYTADLSAYDGQDVMIRWNFSTDGSVTYEGWYVDDVTVTHVEVSGPCESTPADVAFLTARSTSGQVKLEWVNPSGAYGSTRICRDPSSYPTDPASCSTALADQAGAAGAYDTYTDTTAANGTKYYYTAFVNNGSGVYSGGVNAWAYPFATTGKVKWAYSSAASSLAPPGVRPGAIGTGGTWAVSNDRLLHGMNPTSAGGDWPRTTPYSWVPMAMNGPAQARPPVVPTTAVPGASNVIFLGSEDGHAYAANAQTGTALWQSPALANILLASPSGMFTDFGGSWNLLFIGTRDATGNNIMYALDPADGSVKYQFNNGGGANGIGIISSAATVDYANNRIYFASRTRAGGSHDTLWCLSFNDTGFTKEWSTQLNDIDGTTVLYQGRLYVGNNLGSVAAVDPDTGVADWVYPAFGDGAVKGFVTPQALPTTPRRLYFSTTTKLWSINDLGDTASSGWSVTTVPGPSIPLAPLGADVLYTGSSDGRLYQLDAATGAVQTSALLGDGAATIGSPALDVVNNMAYVGSESGAVYGVELPLQ